MNYDTRIVTAPRGLPLAMSQVKLNLGIYDTNRDTLVPGWIRRAWEDAEALTNLALLHTRYALTVPAFPCESLRIGNQWAYKGIVIPHAPLVRVVSVEYVDGAGVTQVLDPAAYTVNRTALPSFITPSYAYTWPSTREQLEAVTVTYDAGHASVVTADATADTLTSYGPVTWIVGDVVRVSNSGGALPAPLEADREYYVQSASSGVYKLAATSGGSAIDLTDAGTGTHYIGVLPARAIQWMLAKCGEQADMQKLDFVDDLLDRLRVILP